MDLSPDHAVSRRHAEVWFEDGAWWVRDLRSRHGTTLAGRRLTPEVPMRSEPGVAIGLGGAEFTIVTPDWQRVRDDALVLDLALCSRLSYALARFGVQPVSHLVVRNWGENARAPSQLELSWPRIGSAVITLPRLAAGESRALPAPAFALDEAALRDATDHSWRPLSLLVNRRRIDDGRVGCAVLSSSEWSYVPEHRLSLASFVQPNDPTVIRTTRAASAGWSLGAGSTDALQRLYDYLSAWHIDYRRDRPPTKAHSQQLRSAADVLWDSERRTGEGTCIDLAVLIAGALETLRLQPLLAVVDRGRSWHALVGCWRRAGRRVDAMPAERAAFLEDAVWVDPNGCTSDPAQRAAFAAAVARAHRDLTENPLVFAIDVAAARAVGIDPLPIHEQSGQRRRPHRGA